MSEAPVFRRARADEGGLLREITREAYAKWVGPVGREPRPMVADHDAAVREHLVEFVEMDGAVVAAVELVPQDGYLLVENIAVRIAAQRRGLGDTILERAEQVARGLKLPVLRLYTHSRMGTNVDWYLKRGYAIEREEPFGNGNRVHFVKTLPVQVA
ncbi:MAG: GNAT family N-acetyltransferase [Rhodospirillales bacterium]|nr:GNAT family N-acetyltransferase [Rhodospirillales bacterium]